MLPVTSRFWRALILAVAYFGAGIADSAAAQFIGTAGTYFTIGGRPYFVAGVNNHYLTSGTTAEVTGVLDAAVAMGANVVRTYLQPIIGSLDGSKATVWDWKSGADSSDLGVHGTYLLYWDSDAGRMAINGGPNGLGKIDFLIAEAAKRRLRLIIAFCDFWSYTGGAQQMRAWYGSTDKNGFFFSDPRIKADYRKWIASLLQRVNPLTGKSYKNDPTIMAWELMNEPNAEPEAVRLAWYAEMSAYVKSQDPNHLVGTGHANVLDQIPELAITSIDFGTWHGYPLYRKLTVTQFNDLIPRYCGLAAARRKPVLLEEFGYARSNPDQADAYAMWLDRLSRDPNCAGWLVWRLVSRQASGRFPKDDYDQFDIHQDGGRIWQVVKAGATAAAARNAATPGPMNETADKRRKP